MSGLSRWVDGGAISIWEEWRQHIFEAGRGTKSSAEARYICDVQEITQHQCPFLTRHRSSFPTARVSGWTVTHMAPLPQCTAGHDLGWDSHGTHHLDTETGLGVGTQRSGSLRKRGLQSSLESVSRKEREGWSCRGFLATTWNEAARE